MESIKREPDTPENILADSSLVNMSKDEIDSVTAVGFMLYHQGKIKEAQAIFEGLIGFDGDFFYPYAGLTGIALALEKLNETIGYLQVAVLRKPDVPALRSLLGEVLLRKAKFDEAVSEMEKALALDATGKELGAKQIDALMQERQVPVSHQKRQEQTELSA